MSESTSDINVVPLESPEDLVPPIAGTSRTPSGIEALVCAGIAERQQLGIAKYGKTVSENPLNHRAWLEHAYQECLDMAIYLRRAMEELD